MYQKISKKKFYNLGKRHYFYESVFSINGIKKVSELISNNDFICIEFLKEQKDNPLFEDSINIYLFKTRKEILRIIKKLDNKKRYVFVNIPVELIKYLKMKDYFIYSNLFPSTDILAEVNYPYLIIGRNFSNENQSDPYTNEFVVNKFKSLTFLEILTASIIIIGFLFMFIYSKYYL